MYPLFENGNKSIKINKERGAVYNDFDFDSTELLSECTSNITYSQTLVQDASDVFSLNSDELVPQMSIDHAVLEADKNNEPVFTTHWLLITLITIFHQVHQTKSA